MLIQRLEICFGWLKMVVEFAIVFVEAVGFVINHTNSANSNYIPVPYVGILP
ncbi:hypothetical protein ACS0TY_002560 [Phlomoides rotata]